MAKPKDLQRSERALPALPPTVKLQIVAGGREWRFRRRLAHALAVPVLLLALLFGLHAVGLARLPGPPPKMALMNAHAITCLLLAAALHLGTLRWRVRVDGAGVGIDRSSWLWPRVVVLPHSVLDGSKHRLSHTVSSGKNSDSSKTVHYHAIFAPMAHGKEVKLTPGLPGPPAAATVIRHLRWAASEPMPAVAGASPGIGPGRWHLFAWGGWMVVVVLGWLALLVG